MTSDQHGFTRKHDARTGVPYVTTTVRISGEKQIETWQAMCLVQSQRPHQLAGEIVLQAIRRAQQDKNIRALTETLHGWRERHAKPERRLRLVKAAGDD